MTRLAGVLAVALALPACPGDDDDDDADLPTLAPLVDGLDGAIMSIWGRDATNVFAVGGQPPVNPDTELHEIILWSDGDAWHRMELDVPTLWWVSGFGFDDMWSVGELGTILHFDGDAWTTVETGADYTLYGVWGAAPDDVWTVGGAFLPSTHGAFRHWDGAAWSDVEGVDLEGRVLFKVWGAARDDVWVVGHDRGAGLALHWDGSEWTTVDVPAPERLVTVSGRASDDVWAVGGLSAPILVHWDGTSWTRLDTPDLYVGLMGVWTAPGQPVLVTGAFGALGLVTLDGDVHTLAEATDLDLHTAWGDAEGRRIAGGGALMSPTDPQGILVGVGDLPGAPVQDWP